jgi:MoxR-like ATPase
MPRVLLVDELDKASVDLPNDLLHILEEGRFRIPELARVGGRQRVQFADSVDTEDALEIKEGWVATRHFPIVVVTSNEERDFSDAFVRRCVRLKLEPLKGEQLAAVVRAQFGDALPADVGNDPKNDLPTDVVIQSLFASHNAGFTLERARELLRRG